jgi:hypothetical protein
MCFEDFVYGINLILSQRIFVERGKKKNQVVGRCVLRQSNKMNILISVAMGIPKQESCA